MNMATSRHGNGTLDVVQILDDLERLAPAGRAQRNLTAEAVGLLSKPISSLSREFPHSNRSLSANPPPHHPLFSAPVVNWKIVTQNAEPPLSRSRIDSSRFVPTSNSTAPNSCPPLPQPPKAKGSEQEAVSPPVQV